MVRIFCLTVFLMINTVTPILLTLGTVVADQALLVVNRTTIILYKILIRGLMARISTRMYQVVRAKDRVAYSATESVSPALGHSSERIL